MHSHSKQVRRPLKFVGCFVLKLLSSYSLDGVVGRGHEVNDRVAAPLAAS